MTRAKRHYIPEQIWHTPVKQASPLWNRLHISLGKRWTGTYAELKSSHRGWIEESLGDGKKGRQGEWTNSIAVGSRAFTERVKSPLGFKAKGRDII